MALFRLTVCGGVLRLCKGRRTSGRLAGATRAGGRKSIGVGRRRASSPATSAVRRTVMCLLRRRSGRGDGSCREGCGGRNRDVGRRSGWGACEKQRPAGETEAGGEQMAGELGRLEREEERVQSGVVVDRFLRQQVR
ncbi:unnamed protein product [Linum trigynum]|uniref:Uncharacterized protein n=1 Tax=Linum trigynum TaxID=586398 RepID=A0AAV2CGA4_9ROSI